MTILGFWGIRTLLRQEARFSVLSSFLYVGLLKKETDGPAFVKAKLPPRLS